MNLRPLRRLRLPAVLAAALAATALAPSAGPASASPSPERVASAPTGVVSLLDTVDGLRLRTDRTVTVRPAAAVTAVLDLDAVTAALATVPSRARVAAGAAPVEVSLPAPDGTTAVFSVVEDSVMMPRLQAAHPELRSYAGTGVSNPAETIRFDVTPLGLHASVRDLAGRGAWYVDPAYVGGPSREHLSYFRSDLPERLRPFTEREVTAPARASLGTVPVRRAADGQVVVQRTYRMAFVTEQTYAKYFGKANVLATKVSQINRTDHIYLDDMAIKFVLAEGSDKLSLDTDARASGPHGPCGASACFAPDETTSCGGNAIDRNNFVAGQIIGADRFDIGHFGSGGGSGGVAYLGVVGTDNKAGGCTALDTPSGDFYTIDFFAHEVGHQMGGNHTFNGTNGSCAGINRNGETSVEPGSGSTVMAYAGICSNDDLQPHTDPYFSQRTIDEFTAVTTAKPERYSEQQVVNLRSFGAKDSFRLTYRKNGRTAFRAVSAKNYSEAGLAKVVAALTGRKATVSGYDGGDLGPRGFTVDFTGKGDPRRLGLKPRTGGVKGFVGVIVDGGKGTNQGIATRTTNHAPVVTAPADKALPIRTPFELTGSATDQDRRQDLTYLWEQNDAGLNPVVGSLLVAPDKSDGPLFRVFGDDAVVTPEDSLEYESDGENLADGNPSRTFPDMAQVLAGNTNAATGLCPLPTTDPLSGTTGDVLDCYSEFLPGAAYALLSGELNFRLTARDGATAGGGVGHDDVTLSLDPLVGPFLVTSQAGTDTAVRAGSTQTVTWDVAGTDAERFAPQVRISVSLDGGRTFEVVKAATANDGSQEITLPDETAARARIKVAAVGNYFFAVNDAPFAITRG